MIETRVVVRCISCRLNQFATRNGKCRRCDITLPTTFVTVKKETLKVIDYKEPQMKWMKNLAAFIFRQAQAANLSPWKLAKEKCGVDKHIISRLQRGDGTINLKTLAKLACGMELSLSEMLLQMED